MLEFLKSLPAQVYLYGALAVLANIAIFVGLLLFVRVVIRLTTQAGKVPDRWFRQRVGAELKRIVAVEPLLRDGRPGRGQVVELRDTGMTLQGDDNYVVRVLVAVTPLGATGEPIGPAYTTECKMFLLEDERPRFEAGTVHEVRIDPKDPQRIAVVGTNFALARHMAALRAIDLG